VRAQQSADRHHGLYAYVAVLAVGLVIGLAGFGPFDVEFALAFALLACAATAVLLRPIAGVYITVFFALLGDGVAMVGYPFNINFSSPESILYVNGALTFSPVELFLVLTGVSWFAHLAGTRSWHVFGRPLLWPLVVFAGLIGVGLLYGVGLYGGDLTTGMWELRPLLYAVAMYFFASNLFTRTAHYVSLAWAVVLAISVQNIFAIAFYLGLSAPDRLALESLTEHPTSVFYAWVILLTLAVCVLRGCSRWARFLLVLAVIPTVYVFVLSQRRAAFVALAAGFVVFAIVLFFRRRKAFYILLPTVLILTAGYTAAFWNANDGVGFGARAIKSVFAPDEVSERDSASDIYRAIENYNLVYTIRAEPLTGVGFGKPFYQPAPLPNISWFVFYQYIPHNSVLWIWLKMGLAGFVTLLFIIAATIRAGIRASLRVPSGDALAVTVSALAFVVMFFVFAYVDLAFNSKTCLFLAVCMAACVNMPRLAARREAEDGEISERELVLQS
jgi:O-antigen ligase